MVCAGIHARFVQGFMHGLCKCSCNVCTCVHAMFVHVFMQCLYMCSCNVCTGVHAMCVQVYTHIYTQTFLFFALVKNI